MAKAIHKYIEVENQNILTEVYNKFQVKLYRLAFHYLRTKQAAEDVVADVFAKIIESDIDLNKINNKEGYLYLMVKRRSLDELQKFSNKKNLELDTVLNSQVFVTFNDPETEYLNRELALKISSSINRLPEKCRMVFLMVKEDKLKYKEVAQILDISEKTVEMHMGLALKSLRIDLQAFKKPDKAHQKLNQKINIIDIPVALLLLQKLLSNHLF
ncbi:MAG: sigma-70 family RNA polymerase sigma factor [Cyclobacteriaceae bacterium]